ncbi:hypothetical protein L1987_76142 [Smallanthus sonchifolius]|uniref:Uncharacterized protein n=1 Tax=Smallanthus sonchifolius TaxID=185202 RepID=A0ACB9A7X6_9ASTR|nr:hypothetical protein L1987_76142 [Smallanthus sonchifolius]
MVVVSSVEKGRRWRSEEDEAMERGLRRSELRRARAMSYLPEDKSLTLLLLHTPEGVRFLTTRLGFLTYIQGMPGTKMTL